MWKLINVKKEHLEQYVLVGEEVVVGRKDATLMIVNDPSVSRKHAVLRVTHSEENLGNPSMPSSLFLRDEGSKYGTFKNDVRIAAEVELQENDVVKFGQFESEYRVCKLPLVVTTSCLDVAAKRTLKRTIHSLGGHFVSEWQPVCSHLVMSEVKVTIKALCCLCSVKPIVKPDYFVALLESLSTSSKLVDPKQYIPPIGEALIDKDVVSFDINNQRKTLFKNKNFFFLDEKQFKKLHLGIVLGGGNVSILSSEKVSSDLLLEDGCCVIEPAKEFSQVGREILLNVSSILQANKLRLIPESDVGLAVAYCSTEKFCNPKFSMGDAMFNNHNLQSQTLSVREVYVPDTQERIVSSERARCAVPDIDNSLNLTSFRADAVEEMELSEIPLSAQVKRELDDIFNEPMEIPNSPPKLKAPDTSFVTSSEKTRKLKSETPLAVENKKSPVSKQNTEPYPVFRTRKQLIEKRLSVSPQKHPQSNKRIKEENNIVEDIDEDVNQERITMNGRNSVKPEEPDLDKINELLQPELPSNLMKVEIVSLVCKRNNPLPQAQKYNNSNVKNFKKFKKVHPKKSQALPKIIGAHELVPYDKIAAQISNEEWDDHDHPEEVIQPIRGAFDWDTPSV